MVMAWCNRFQYLYFPFHSDGSYSHCLQKVQGIFQLFHYINDFFRLLKINLNELKQKDLLEHRISIHQKLLWTISWKFQIVLWRALNEFSSIEELLLLEILGAEIVSYTFSQTSLNRSRDSCIGYWIYLMMYLPYVCLPCVGLDYLINLLVVPIHEV